MIYNLSNVLAVLDFSSDISLDILISFYILFIYFIYYLLFYFFPFILFQDQLVEREEAFLTPDFVYFIFLFPGLILWISIHVFCQLFYIHGLAIMYNQIIEIKMIYNFFDCRFFIDNNTSCIFHLRLCNLCT